MILERLESRIALSGDPLVTPWLAGDVNENGSVGFDDLLTLSQHIGLAGEFSRSQGDIDGDGTVGFAGVPAIDPSPF